MKKVTVIIPAYNECGNFEPLFDSLARLMDSGMTTERYEWEILVVDDGSRDGSGEKLAQYRAKDSRINYLCLSRNFGKENAMLAGFDYATGDAVIIMDADMQDPIEVVPLMLDEWERGYADVYGRRRSRGSESWLRRSLTRMFYRLLQRSTHIDVLPDVGDFRLLDRQCVDVLCTMRESQRYTKGLYSWIGFNKKEVLFDRDDRRGGKSSFNLGRLFNLAIEGITSFTTAPLRFASLMGILTALIALIYLIYIFVKTLLYGDPVAGYPTIMCVMLFLGGTQLIALGIIGEYIARIFNETKHRPPYIPSTLNGKPLNGKL